jgi:hypothetical protein
MTQTTTVSPDKIL